MNEIDTTTGVSRGVRSGGPNPGVLALIAFALGIAAIVVGTVTPGGAVLGSPFAPTDEVVARFAGESVTVRWVALLQFGSAVPLGIFAATVYARQLRLGIRVPGPAIGFFGGITASILLMVSALVGWVLSRPEVTVDATLTHAFAFLSFATGGVGYVVGIGLLIAGIAVPGLILGLMPRWLAWTGLVIAALSEIAFLSLVFEPLQVLIPVGRFGGGIWLIAAGFLLPVSRAAANRDRQELGS